MVIVLTIITVLVIALGIMSINNAEKIDRMQVDYYDVLEILLKLTQKVREYEKDGKCFMAIDEIKRTINDTKANR